MAAELIVGLLRNTRGTGSRRPSNLCPHLVTSRTYGSVALLGDVAGAKAGNPVPQTGG